MGFNVNSEIKFQGILIYTGNDKEILDLSVPVVFERVTTELSLICDSNVLATKTSITTIQESRRKIRDLDHIIHTDQLLLDLPVTLSRDTWYDLELRMYPTDVTNHYSGFPITTCGAEIWTCYGKNGNATVDTYGVQFRFSESLQGGRCCLIEGQIP